MIKFSVVIASAIALWNCLVGPGDAACVYNREAQAIWIYDYSENLPAQLRHLVFFDQINDWGLVTYDATNAMYTVAANLWIGRNDGSDTYFQIGTPEQPNETLIMKGNLVVYPARIEGENERDYLPGVNRLTIGHPDRADARARLLFLSESKKRYTLLSGPYYQGSKMSPGVRKSGQLHVYHGLISAADPQYPAGLIMYLEDVVLKGATLSRIAGTIAYGTENDAYSKCRIEDTVFECGGNAVAWGKQEMRGVTFRNLQAALTSRLPLAATLTECRFQDNDANWALTTRGSIYMVDCEVNPPLKGNRYAAHTDKSPNNIRITSSRHIIVKVTDKSGNPIKGARIKAQCEQDEGVRREAVTGADGLTPGHGAKGALLLDEWDEAAGMEENKPVRRDFSYTIEAAPTGGITAIRAAFQPTQSWGSAVIVIGETALSDKTPP